MQRWEHGQIDTPAWRGRRPAETFPADPDPLRREGLAACLAACRLSFVSAAEWRWPEGQRVPRRTLPTSNLVLYHAGAGREVVAGERLTIGPGSLVITPRGWAQEVRHDPGKPYHASSLHCQAPVFGGPRDLFEVLGFPLHLHSDPQRDATLVAALAELPRLDALRPPGWLARAEALVTVVVHHLLAVHGGSFTAPAALPADRDAARLAPVLERIEQELESPLRLTELASMVDLRPVAFRQLMRRVTGRSPRRYLQDRRIDRACALLRQGDAPVHAIAAAVGLADPAAFSRLFRSRTGIAPGRWRAAAQRP